MCDYYQIENNMFNSIIYSFFNSITHFFCPKIIAPVELLLKVNEKLNGYCNDKFTNCNDGMIIYQTSRSFKQWFISKKNICDISHDLRYIFDKLEINKYFWNESSIDYVASQLAYHIFATLIADSQKPDAGADSQKPDTGADSQELDAGAIERFKKSFFASMNPTDNTKYKWILRDTHNEKLEIKFTNILFDIDFIDIIPKIIVKYQAL